MVATQAEGLLRATATLRQLIRIEGDKILASCATITDWPNFRYRCAADRLLNCESNRWSYDWCDGRENCVARIKRKLDFCFDHKINQVDVRWFSRCLEVGGQFAEIVAFSAQLRVREDGAVRGRLAEALNKLEAHILSGFRLEMTERLGGDPGCWLNTLGNLRKANGLKRPKKNFFFCLAPTTGSGKREAY